MIGRPKSVTRFERSNGLDTAPHKNYLYILPDILEVYSKHQIIRLTQEWYILELSFLRVVESTTAYKFTSEWDNSLPLKEGVAFSVSSERHGQSWINKIVPSST